MYAIQNLPIAEIAPEVEDNSIATIIPEIINLDELSDDLSVITVYRAEVDMRVIDVIVAYRNQILKFFWVIMLFNTIFCLINPFASLSFPNLLLNIVAARTLRPTIIKATIINNFVVCTLIFIVNIILSVYLSYGSIDILSLLGITYLLGGYYVVLFSFAFIVILMYMYLSQKFYTILILHQRLNSEQVLLLNSIL